MINSFSSYFELFAGLNLGYATIKGFREAANSELFGLKKKYEKLEKEIQRLEDKKTLMVDINPNLVDNFKNYKSIFETKRDEHERTIENIIGLGLGFQVLFLLTCLYCFFLILLGGFENYLTNPPPIANTLAFLNMAYCLSILLILELTITLRFRFIYVLIAFFVIGLGIIAFYLFLPSIIVSDDDQAASGGGMVSVIVSIIWIFCSNSLINIIICLIVPPFPFALFYVQRYYQSIKAQKRIDIFTDDQASQLQGFKIGVGFLKKSDNN
jgi:hypothetical protein